MESTGSRKRKVLTSRHPNVERRTEDAEQPELRRTALTRTRTVVDSSFSVQGDFFGVVGSIGVETNVIDVKEEPSDTQGQKVEARRTDIVAANTTAINNEDLFEIMANVTYATTNYKMSTAVAIVNIDFKDVRSDKFVQFFFTCVPQAIRHLRLEGDLNLPIAISHQLRRLILHRSLETLVIRDCTRIDGESVFPSNVLSILTSTYAQFCHIVLTGQRGLSQEAVWKFVLSLAQNENPLKFKSASISFEGTHAEMATRIKQLGKEVHASPVHKKLRPGTSEQLKADESQTTTFTNRYGSVSIGLADNVLNITCDY